MDSTVRKNGKQNTNVSNKTNTRSMAKTLGSSAQKESMMTSNIQQKRLETTPAKKIEPYVNTDQKASNKPKMGMQKTTEKIGKIQPKVERHLKGTEIEIAKMHDFNVKPNPTLNATQFGKQNANMPYVSKQKTEPGSMLKKATIKPPSQNVNDASQEKVAKLPLSKRLRPDIPLQDKNKNIESKTKKPLKSSLTANANTEDEKQRERRPKGQNVSFKFS